MILVQIVVELSMHGFFFHLSLTIFMKSSLYLSFSCLTFQVAVLPWSLVMSPVVPATVRYSQLPWVQSKEPWSSGVWGQLVSGHYPCWSCMSVVLSLWLFIPFPDSLVIFHLLGMGGISCLHLPSWLAFSSYIVASGHSVKVLYLIQFPISDSIAVEDYWDC